MFDLLSCLEKQNYIDVYLQYVSLESPHTEANDDPQMAPWASISNHRVKSLTLCGVKETLKTVFTKAEKTQGKM